MVVMIGRLLMAKTREDYLTDVDKVLVEVREMIDLTRDTGEVNELVALQMLLKVTKELHHIHKVSDLITKVLDSSIAFVDADRAFLMLLDEDNEPRFKMGRDRDGNYLNHGDFSPSTGAIEEVMQSQHTIIVPD